MPIANYLQKKKQLPEGIFQISMRLYMMLWYEYYDLHFFKSSRYSQEKNIKNIPTKKEETQMTYNLTILSNYYWITLYHCKVPLCLQRSISNINNFANVRILFFGILLS